MGTPYRDAPDRFCASRMRGPAVVGWIGRVVACALILLLTKAQAAGAAAEGVEVTGSEMGRRLQAHVIWSPDAPVERQGYVGFRGTFDIAGDPRQARLTLFADSRYILWVNGQYIERGPCRFDPQRVEYDDIDLTGRLVPGRNVIAVLVHNARHLLNARIISHRPGLAASISGLTAAGQTFTFATGPDWRANVDLGWHPAPEAGGAYGDPPLWAGIPLAYAGIPDDIDARRGNLNWIEPAFEDSGWSQAQLTEGNSWGGWCQRTLPRLQERPLSGLTLAASKEGQRKPVAALPTTLDTPAELWVDVGAPTQAYAELGLDFTQETELEMRFLETVDDLRDPHNHAARRVSRFVAAAGLQRWLTGDTYGFRYLHLRVIKGKCTLQQIRIVERLYPFQQIGAFTSNLPSLDEIWQQGVNTVRLCSEDAFVDCTSRERAQWMADGFLLGYRVAGVALAASETAVGPRYNDVRLLQNLIRHVALSQLPDGQLQPMRPSDYPPTITHGTIDDYSCLWVLALKEYYERTRDAAFLAEQWPVLERTLAYFIRHRSATGLYRMQEFIFFGNPLIYRTCDGASANAYLYGALRAAADLAAALDQPTSARRYRTLADELAAQYHKVLWDESAGGYRSAADPGLTDKGTPGESLWSRQNVAYKDQTARGIIPVTAHATLMALYFGLVPAQDVPRALALVQEKLPMEGAFPYTWAFFLEVLFNQDRDELDRYAIETISQRWHPMQAYTGGQTVSENWQGGQKVHVAGAAPSYLLSRYVLGVRHQASRTTKHLLIQPQLGPLTHAAGTVGTEYGPVKVAWRRDAQGFAFEFTVPDGVVAKVRLPALNSDDVLVINGAIAKDQTRGGRWLGFEARTGTYRGCIKPKDRLGDSAVEPCVPPGSAPP